MEIPIFKSTQEAEYFGKKYKGDEAVIRELETALTFHEAEIDDLFKKHFLDHQSAQEIIDKVCAKQFISEALEEAQKENKAESPVRVGGCNGEFNKGVN